MPIIGRKEEKMAETTKQKKPSIWKRIGKFFKDYRKLVWPTPKQLLKNSAVVLVSIIVVGACLALVDYGLNKGITEFKDLIDFIRPVS